MRIEITFSAGSARSAEYYLRKRYKSKASFAKLAKRAILTEVASEAKSELAQIYKES